VVLFVGVLGVVVPLVVPLVGVVVVVVVGAAAVLNVGKVVFVVVVVLAEVLLLTTVYVVTVVLSSGWKSAFLFLSPITPSPNSNPNKIPAKARSPSRPNPRVFQSQGLLAWLV